MASSEYSIVNGNGKLKREKKVFLEVVHQLIFVEFFINRKKRSQITIQ
jgi:hypothetical protein